jgi:16S rRNA pseudouridine516 synthase
MYLSDALFTQGFGTRRECDALARSGSVLANGRRLEDPWAELDRDGLVLTVDGVAWPVVEHAVVMLHKPAGYECSQRPSAWPSVLSLLPLPLRRRGVQPVGRLDADTTGLLLLTDDGALIHRWTSPKRHVPKVYELTTADPIQPTLPQRLLGGVQLREDPKPARAAICELTGERSLRMTLTEGRYHQVKRMLGAVGHRVESLHRSSFGRLQLPATLEPGQWMWVDPEMV